MELKYTALSFIKSLKYTVRYIIRVLCIRIYAEILQISF